MRFRCRVGVDGYFHGRHGTLRFFLRLFVFGKQLELLILIKILNLFLVLLIEVTDQLVLVGFDQR